MLSPSQKDNHKTRIMIRGFGFWLSFWRPYIIQAEGKENRRINKKSKSHKLNLRFVAFGFLASVRRAWICCISLPHLEQIGDALVFFEPVFCKSLPYVTIPFWHFILCKHLTVAHINPQPKNMLWPVTMLLHVAAPNVMLMTE